MGKKKHFKRSADKSRKPRPRIEDPDRPEDSGNVDLPVSYYYDYDDSPDYSESDDDLIYREDDTINMRATKWD